MIYAVDFDGTICEHKFPEIGKPNLIMIKKLKMFKARGDKLILWTCRRILGNRDVLQEEIDWCKNKGIEFDAVNEDLPEIKNSDFGRSKSIKIFADFYIDDRNIMI